MMKDTSTVYDYKSSWGRYAFDDEENRFLSSDEEDLLKICDCIDLSGEVFEKTSGGIPVHYSNGKLYVLKEGPHARVEGESGSKKSRTVCRGAAVTAVLNRDSFIMTDPKGEIYSDPKIQWLLHKAGVETYVLDFRSFDKDGVNPLSHAFELLKQGKRSLAMASIDKFVSMLIQSHQGADDPYWNSQGGDMIKFSTQMLLTALSQMKDGEKAFNLSSVKSFIRQNKEPVQNIMERMAKEEPDCNSIKGFNEIVSISADKTYSCVVSSANALLSDFASSDELLHMMSIQTVDIRKFYFRPCALFLIIPDEHNTYNTLAGYLIDQFYQILVETFNEKYLNRQDPRCNIKFICDEAANLKINDMASKVSASRSRKIDWTLIFQSERQMAEAYKKDWSTICGNCKHRIYLGSSDYEILRNISEQVGISYISKDGRAVPLVSVDDLRRMRKENGFKDALILTGNYIYCAELPDYDVYEFLKSDGIAPEKRISRKKTCIYTPEDLYEDYYMRRINFSDTDTLFAEED